jgi:hypothetical protein
MHRIQKKSALAAPVRILFRPRLGPLGWIFFESRRAAIFFGLPPFRSTTKEQGAAVHLLVDAISKTRTTPHHKDTTWSRIKPIGRTDDADRGTCDLAVFGTLLCPGGGGDLVLYAGAAGAKFSSFPSRCASEDQSGRVVRGRK